MRIDLDVEAQALETGPVRGDKASSNGRTDIGESEPQELPML